MKNDKKKQHGVTLVSLTLSVIILLMLAVMTMIAAYKARIIRTAVQSSYDYSKQAIDENRIFENTTSYVHSVADEIKDIVNEWNAQNENNVE